jgi:ParB family chromosome partitioning protein
MADITYIPIRQLHPHPDNPRKELGDLSELAASIKENGVYQNLTVIPGHYLSSREYISKCVDEGGDAAAAAAAWAPKVMWVGDDYTIIIGHRRAAAAQQAGLYELPCAIVEMDELEQISDKSGFSQSTVRRRIKLLELNHDSFKKAEKRGATLSDFAQLDKIEDLEARNRVLETLGTQNFNRAMQDALEQQKWQHQKAEWIEQLKKFAVEDPQATYQTHEHVNAYGKWGTKKEVIMPEDADKVAYVYKVSENQIDLYKPRDTEAEDASNSAREAARATEQLAREQFAAVTKLMYELRWDFVKDLTPAECRKHLPEILAYSTPILTEYRHMEDDENVLRLLGIGLDEQIREDTELEDALKMFNAYDTEPEKILLAVAFDATDGIHEGYWSTEWNGPTGASKFVHRKNDDLDSTYELLTALGYEMADDEKALQDGTHQLFAVYGSGSKADTPCDKCKAAHPECDKCCKTCDDHCNAFQLCRKEYGE